MMAESDKITLPRAGSAVRMLLPVALIYGILSALRWPQTYTVSHMVIDYHFGFGKRGLIGLILEHIDRPPYHYVTLASMAFAVFALWIGVFFIAAWHGIRRDSGIAVAVLLLFLSTGFACLVCDIGRGEHFGLALALPCLLMPTGVSWLLLRAALLAIAVLMQEANFPILAPVVAFDVWIGITPRQRFWPVLCAAGTIFPATVLTSYLGSSRTACDLNAATAHFQGMVKDFRMEWVPVSTLCKGGYDNFLVVASALWSDWSKVSVIPLTLLLALPPTLFNLWLALRIMPRRAAAVPACVLAALSPVMLLLVAADVVRFVTMIQLTSLLVLVSVAQRTSLPPGRTLPPTLRSAGLVVALVALELGSSLTLNDGNPVLKFPFEPLVERAIAVTEGRQPFVVIPPF